MREYTCAFTGHRTVPAGLKEAVFRRTVKEVELLNLRGVTRFLSGGAAGYDTIAAFAVMEVKRTRPGIELWMILPCRSQAERWNPREKRIHARLTQTADHVVCLSETWSQGCYHTRNRYLVDNSAHLVAYYTGKDGGTAYTIAYALSNGLCVTNVDSDLRGLSKGI